jgi:hypothetical protein
MQTLGSLAGVAAETSTDSLSELQNPSPVLHAGAALLLLLVAATLSVYKPRGMTGMGSESRNISVQHRQRPLHRLVAGLGQTDPPERQLDWRSSGRAASARGLLPGQRSAIAPCDAGYTVQRRWPST